MTTPRHKPNHKAKSAKRGKMTMNAKAIVYTSNTGHTKQYAEMLGKETGLPVHSLEEAGHILDKGCVIVYMGWTKANHVQGYRAAAKGFGICAVCAVGLSETGTMEREVRNATKIPQGTPLFTIQGGIARGSLKGLDRFMIGMIEKGLASKAQRTGQEDDMLALIKTDATCVCTENLAQVLKWWNETNAVK